jgi:tight adherence protein C
VTAGETLRAALELVAVTVSGPIAEEVATALRASRAGRPLGECLVERADALGEPVFERFVRAVVAASERGVAVGDALRAMAEDARDAQRVTLLEAAGRKQVTMLVPVVALILPVALIFAFFPGVIAIRNLT